MTTLTSLKQRSSFGLKAEESLSLHTYIIELLHVHKIRLIWWVFNWPQISICALPLCWQFCLGLPPCLMPSVHQQLIHLLLLLSVKVNSVENRSDVVKQRLTRLISRLFFCHQSFNFVNIPFLGVCDLSPSALHSFSSAICKAVFPSCT